MGCNAVPGRGSSRFMPFKEALKFSRQQTERAKECRAAHYYPYVRCIVLQRQRVTRLSPLAWYLPGPLSMLWIVPLSSAHFRETMNSNSSEETRLTNCPSVTATCAIAPMAEALAFPTHRNTHAQVCCAKRQPGVFLACNRVSFSTGTYLFSCPLVQQQHHHRLTHHHPPTAVAQWGVSLRDTRRCSGCTWSSLPSPPVSILTLPPNKKAKSLPYSSLGSIPQDLIFLLLDNVLCLPSLCGNCARVRVCCAFVGSCCHEQ